MKSGKTLNWGTSSTGAAGTSAIVAVSAEPAPSTLRPSPQALPASAQPSPLPSRSLAPSPWLSVAMTMGSGVATDDARADDAAEEDTGELGVALDDHADDAEKRRPRQKAAAAAAALANKLMGDAMRALAAVDAPLTLLLSEAPHDRFSLLPLLLLQLMLPTLPPFRLLKSRRPADLWPLFGSSGCGFWCCRFF